MTTETLERNGTETAPAEPPARPSGLTYADLWKNAVALVFECKRMGVTRVVTGHTPAGADPEMTRTTKYIIKDKRYRAIANLDHRIKHQIEKIGLPVSKYFKGVVIVPLNLIDKAEALLARYEAERQAAVTVLKEAWDEVVAQSVARLGTVGDPSDYPPKEQIPDLFSVSTNYLTFDLPGVLDVFSSKAQQRAMAEGGRKLEAAVEEMQQHLRETMAGLVTHLSDRLTPDPVTGEAKVLYARTVQNLKEFLDLFADLNAAARDRDLPTLVQQARQLLAGVEVPALRKDQALRDVVREGLEAIATRMDTLLVKKGARQYVWDDEEA